MHQFIDLFENVIHENNICRNFIMKSIFFLRIIAEQDILIDDKCKVWEILKSRMYKKITCLKNLSNENKYLCTYIHVS